MADNVGSIEYDSRISTDKLRKDAADVDRIAKKAGDDLGDHADRGSNRAGEAFQRFGRIAAAALVATGAAVVAFGVSSAKAFIESENAIAQTEAVLKSTGQAAGVTSKTVTDLANSLQRQTRYSDETIRSAENMLLTFTNIGQKTFPGATEAVLDMATAMGSDLQSTAIQVGKALQDPVLGATALQRVGVRLTESQKDTIKSLVDVGDAAGAQAIILKELQTEFGGSAKAAGKTFAGQLDILKNQLGEVQESIGEVILKGLTPFVTKLLTLYESAGGVEGIMTSLAEAIKPIATSVISVANQVGGYLLPKLSELWGTIRDDLLPALEGFMKAFGPTVGKGIVWAVGLAIDILKIFLEALSPVINFMKDNTWVVWGMVGAFAAIKTALIIDAAVQSFLAALALARGGMALTTGSAAVTTGAVGSLRGALMLLSGPWQMTLAILGVGSVLFALQQVADMIGTVKRKVEDLSKTKVNVGGQEVSGTSDIGLTAQIRNAFSGFGRAKGGPVSANQAYIVGENQPEIFVPRTSGTIIPEVPNPSKTRGSSITLNVNMTGIMSRSKADERSIAKSLVQRLNEELSAKGQPILGGGAL